MFLVLLVLPLRAGSHPQNAGPNPGERGPSLKFVVFTPWFSLVLSLVGENLFVMKCGGVLATRVDMKWGTFN